MTFSRAVRVLALLLVVAAVWRTRPAVDPPRVAVLVLPGTPADALATQAAIATGPVVTDKSISTGSAFWTRLLAIEDVPGREPGATPALWDTGAGQIRTFGGPSRIFGGSDSAAAFSGSSSGVLVDDADLSAGRIPPPYDRAIEAVASVAAVLGRDQWSEWLRVTPAPDGSGKPDPLPAEFQFARVGDSAWFFSPAYVVGVGIEAGEPFLRGADRELRPLLADHVLQLGQRRAQRLEETVRSPQERRPLLVFDPLGDELASVFAPDVAPAAVTEQRDASIVAALSVLRGAVGSDGVVLVVGGPSTGRSFLTPWYRVCEGREAGAGVRTTPDVAPAALDFVSVRALLRYLVSVALEAGEKDSLPAELSARFPVKARIDRPLAPASRPATFTPWSASSLESIPGAVVSGH